VAWFIPSGVPGHFQHLTNSSLVHKLPIPQIAEKNLPTTF